MAGRYAAVVDPDATNSAHAFALAMVGANQRVLELGAAGGHVTRALVEQGCRVTAVEYDTTAAAELAEFAERVIVGDLNDPATLDALEEQFDVVLAGDVLEHLVDPQDVLSRVRRRMTPHGRIVVSLPHIGHVDVRLALLRGRFDYTETGLLDNTHLRFFTLKSIEALVEQADLVITDLRRVRVPAFESELKVERAHVPPQLLAEILTDPEAETYQYVFTCVRPDTEAAPTALLSKVAELEAECARLSFETQSQQARLRTLGGHTTKLERHITVLQESNKVLAEQLRTTEEELRDAREAHLVALAEQRDRAEHEAATLRATNQRLTEQRFHAEQEARSLRESRTLRYTAGARTAYGALQRLTGNRLP